ncbi:LPS export ABC transporter periplasmic protein LptC [Sandarakinorhabdus sp.]|uniref:LPS export ABC transporter periplasmic protein LptC n=1 Tax=Sandarakinorhabdus sp. TaxID=1916663 RepID=UPI00286EAEC5|nr:LPS export ABC transporter periplasmic protein LptC [Sandarakinorhabdus sp.]
MPLPAVLSLRQQASLPGSAHDGRMILLKWLLPLLAAAMTLTILIWPLLKAQEFSFLLAKDAVMKAGERLRVDRARYSGETARGEPFVITADGAVQRSSSVRQVEMRGLAASLTGKDGPAMLTAPTGRYFLDSDKLLVGGPVKMTSKSGYSLDSNDISVDLGERRINTTQKVSGTLPMGSFRSDKLSGDLDGRTLVLEGHVHLRIWGRKGRGRR